LRASGLHGNEVPEVNLPVIASRYLAEIRKVQPAGPYLILGQCGTSLVAYEMVQQLLRDGEEVSGLILIDPATSTYVPWLSASGMQRVLLQTRANQRGQELQMEAFQSRDLSGVERRRMVKQALSYAVGAYTPKPMDVEALIICSSGRVKKLLNSVRGYPALISRLESQEIEGDHAELFMEFFRLRPAKIAVTGNYINQFLARVAPV
jgi:thioesterase domain-containing protein